MNKLRRKMQRGLVFSNLAIAYLLMSTSVFAQEGQGFDTGNIEDILWKVVYTIQALAIPITGIALAAVGIGIMTSGEDEGRKSQLKSIGTKILIGGVLIFGATTLARLIASNINLG